MSRLIWLLTPTLDRNESAVTRTRSTLGTNSCSGKSCSSGSNKVQKRCTPLRGSKTGGKGYCISDRRSCIKGEKRRDMIRRMGERPEEKTRRKMRREETRWEEMIKRREEIR